MSRYKIRKDRTDTTGYPWHYWGVSEDSRLDYGSRETQALALESVIADDRLCPAGPNSGQD